MREKLSSVVYLLIERKKEWKKDGREEKRKKRERIWRDVELEEYWRTECYCEEREKTKVKERDQVV